MSTPNPAMREVAAPHEGFAPEVLFGVTDQMNQIRQTVERVAAIRVPVLLRGESGSGKEVVARYLHRISPWRDEPFVKVNCSAIPGTLLESELFGYEKGAFTGAYNRRAGKFETANGGTLVLDEIAEIDSSLQAKLLQALQDGRFNRIGGVEEQYADVRVICITSRDIESEIERGQFRRDLFYRINVIQIELPPLRERREDVPVLVEHFLRQYGQEFGRKVSAFPAALMERFQQHHWPGNIRELENYVKRYVILNTEEAVLSELGQVSRGAVPQTGKLPPITDFSLKKYSKIAREQAERYLIREALKSTRWKRKDAAQLLGISYRALLYKMKEAGLQKKERKTDLAAPAVPSP